MLAKKVLAHSREPLELHTIKNALLTKVEVNVMWEHNILLALLAKTVQKNLLQIFFKNIS